MTLYQWLFWAWTLLGAGIGRVNGDTLAGVLIGAGVGILSAFFFLYLTPKG